MRKTLILIAALAALLVPQAQAGKVFVQWAQSNPGDWTLVNSDSWAQQQTRADPGTSDIDQQTGASIGESLLTGQKGYVYAINVQGVVFETADHFAVESLPDGGTRVTAMYDDTWWWPAGTREVAVWDFHSLKFDPKIGADNTFQCVTIYAEPFSFWWGLTQMPQTECGPITLRPYSEFVGPPASAIKHGVWVSQAKIDAFDAARTQHGWREWAT